MSLSSVRALRMALARPACLLLLCVALPQDGRADTSIRFSDVTAPMGIAVTISHGGPEKDWIAEANGSGVAVLDFDGDGWMDILLVSGGTIPELRRIAAGRPVKASGQRLHLYRNRNGVGFDDVTASSGLDLQHWGTAANAADYDNDGDVDILVTTIGVDRLFRNEGNGTFSEVGLLAGLGQVPEWHTGSSFGDIDSDGDLDLYVAGYLSLASLPVEGQAPVCDYRGLRVFCGPLDLEPARDTLYRNNGDGTFTDITDQALTGPPRAAPGFTPVIEDFTGDGHLDILVANDSTPNFLFVNRGDGTFREDALLAGVAVSGDGREQADMGVCAGDFDGDGDLDLLTTTFSEDYFPLFQQQSQGVFEDVSFRYGLTRETTPLLGWGCGFSDLDNDGDSDLWLANGHVYPSAGGALPTSYRQPIRILANQDGRFRRAEGAAEGTAEGSYRGAASLDFDNDGRVDLLAVPVDGSPVLLRNVSGTRNAWLGLRLVDRDGNVEGIGARIEVEYCGSRQSRTIRNGGSYASRSDPRLHFGLGGCDSVDALTVRWPHGPETTASGVAAGQWLELSSSDLAGAPAGSEADL